MLDLSSSVILPQDEYQELMASAFQNVSTSQRIIGTIHATVIFGALVGAWGGGLYLWNKAMAEERQDRLEKARVAKAEKLNVSL